MNKVIAFGCSFTYGHELSDCPTHDYPTHSNLTYAALTAKHLSKDYQCCAVGASANNAISRHIIESVASIGCDDLVLVMWSFPIRRELLSETGYCSITPGDQHDFSKQYFRYINTDPVYLIKESLKEIYITQTLLEQKSINYIFMSADTGLSHALQTNNVIFGNLLPMIDLDRWLFLENNWGFNDWAKFTLKLNFGQHHPPDFAHEVLCDKILERWNQIA